MRCGTNHLRGPLRTRRLLTICLLAVVIAPSILAVVTLPAPPAVADQAVPVPEAQGGTLIHWGSGSSGVGHIPASLNGKVVTAAVAGQEHAVALDKDGTLYAWGDNDFGQLNIPQPTSNATVTAIAVGSAHTLALTTDHKVVAWGYDSHGQSTVPAEVAAATITAVAAGDEHSLALTAQGKVIAWGNNSVGQATVPAELNSVTVTAIAASATGSMALTSQGKVVVWGLNGGVQLLPPSAVQNKIVTKIAMGHVFAMAQTSDGAVYYWSNTQPVEQIYAPPGPSGVTVTAISGGNGGLLILKSDGTVEAAGVDDYGLDSVPAAVSSKVVTGIGAGTLNDFVIVQDFRALGVPQVVGTFATGQVLHVTDPGYNAPPSSFSCAWELVDPGSGAAMPSQTGECDYTLPAAAVGKRVRVTVTASSGQRPDVVQSSDLSQVVVGGQFSTPPQAAVAGSYAIGSTLTASAGSPAPVPDSVSYTWYVNAVEVGTGPTYTLTAADVDKAVQVRAVAKKVGYQDSESISVPQLFGRKPFTAVPEPSATGTLAVGETLTGTTGPIDPVPDSVTYTWSADRDEVGTGDTYTLTEADLGKAISVAITATRAGYYDATVRSSILGVVEQRFVTPPKASFTGTVAVGETLTASAGSPDPVPDLVFYTWYRDGSTVGLGQTYTVMPADVGASITVKATAQKSGYASVESTSPPQGPVQRRDFTVGPTAEFVGDVLVGRRLVALTPTTVPSADSVTYTWYSDGTPVGTGPAYRLTADDLGKQLTLKVKASRSGYNDVTDVTEPQTVSSVFSAGPEATFTGTLQVGSTLTASPGSPDPADAEVAYTWYADGAEIGTGQTYRLEPSDIGADITVTAVARKEFYLDAESTSPARGPVLGVFASGPTASFTGDVVVDRWLTASAGTSTSPAADLYSYLWYADGVLVDSGPTHQVKSSEVGTLITVEVTAHKEDYVSVTDRSEAGGPVITGGTSATKGQVTVFGANAQGQLDLPDQLASSTITSVAIGFTHGLALTSEGAVIAWGDSDDDYGTTAVPASLAGRTVTAIASGPVAAYALTSDGKVVGWGLGYTPPPSSLADETVTAIAAGSYNTMALTASGKVVSWGDNSYGQNDVPDSLDGKTVTAIATGGGQELALTSDGTVIAWGWNEYGQATVPSSLNGRTVTAIAAGFTHSLALTSDGTVVGWGTDREGEVSGPASLAGTVVTKIAAGFNNTLALTSTGEVKAWGGDENDRSTVPGSLAGKTVIGIAAGQTTSVVLTEKTAVAPRTIDPPTVTGTVRVGSPVTCSAAVGTPGTLTYSWRAGGAELASGAVYTPVAGDLDEKLTCVVTSALAGLDPASSSTTTTAVVAGVRSIGVPVITGSPRVGDELTCAAAPGTAGSLAFTWKTGAVVLASGTSYTPGADLVDRMLICEVTSTVAGYQPASSTATASGPVAPATLDVDPPAITGTPVYGSELTCAATPGTPGALSYRWLVGEDQVGTGPRYSPTIADIGKRLTCVLVADVPGHETATSAVTTTDAVATATRSLDAPVITGTPRVGSALTCRAAAGTPGTLAYGWTVAGVPAGVGGLYVPSVDDLGKEVRCTVTSTEPGYQPASSSAVTSAVTAAVQEIDPPTITGTPTFGTALTCAAAPGTPGSVAYAWTVDGTAVGTGTSYTPTLDDLGQTISCTVTATEDGQEPATSTATTTDVVVEATRTIGVPVITGTPRYNGELTCAPAAGTPGVHAYAWKIGADQVGTGDTYVPGLDDIGKTVTCEVTATEVGYHDATSAATTAAVRAARRTIGAPVITGTPEVGLPSTCSAAAGTPGTLGYTWRAGTDQLGTGAVYVPTPDDVGTKLTCTVTSTETGYETASSSVTTGADVVAGARTIDPPVITGAPRVGTTLTCAAPGTPGSLTFVWSVAGAQVATGASYTPVPGDAGNQVVCTVTSVLRGYATASSSAVTPAPVFLASRTIASPRITGTPRYGTALTCRAAPGTPGTLTYSWSIAGSQVGSGTAYTPVLGDIGKRVTCTVTSTETGFETATASAATADVATAAARAWKVQVQGAPKIGLRLRAVLRVPVVEGPARTTIHYQWAADGRPIRGATGTSLLLVPRTFGTRITVTATVTEPGHTGTTVTSGRTAKVRLQALRLVVDRRLERGSAASFTASHLLPRQRWTLRFADGTLLARGVVGRTVQGVRGTFRVPATRRTGSAYVVLRTRSPGGIVLKQVFVR